MVIGLLGVVKVQVTEMLLYVTLTTMTRARVVRHVASLRIAADQVFIM